MRLFGCLLFMGLVGGCVGTAGVVRELAKDPAHVNLTVSTVWATIHLERWGGMTTNTTVMVGN